MNVFYMTCDTLINYLNLNFELWYWNPQLARPSKSKPNALSQSDTRLR